MQKQLQPTPFEQLLADKIHIEECCRIQEKKINEDINYIQDNALSLFTSGISTLFFSPKDIKKSDQQKTKNITKKIPLTLSDYISITKNYIPVAWEIAQPILIKWSINKAKSWFYNLLHEKKKK